jgi:hypothetical protein
VFGLQTLGVTVLGGAALERYVLPVMPLFYVAVSAALGYVRRPVRATLSTVLTIGLAAASFLPSPFPYPFENDLKFVDFVRLQQRAAAYVEEHYATSTVASAWPFPDALRRPEFGFVSHPIRQVGLHNFDPDVVAQGVRDADVLVTYSRTWEPSWSVLRSAWVFRLLSDYYYYKPQITAGLLSELGFRRVKRWQRGQQWIEVYTRSVSFR